MSKEAAFLFQTDPDRFFAQVANDDDDTRIEALLHDFHDLVLCEVLRYGLRNDRAMVSRLAAMYRDYVTGMAEERCAEILRHASSFVAESPSVSANALLPFLAEDPRRLIASTAVIDFVSLAATRPGDSLSSVKDIVTMIADRGVANPGAAFGALLHIGDPRVCRLLLPLRDELTAAEANEAVQCTTGYVHSATVEFYLDWLEGMDGDLQDGMFGIVASGLAQLARKRHADFVATGERPFPVTGVDRDDYERSMKIVPFDVFVERIANRMRDLERTEPPPRIMPEVLSAWGIKPATPRTEMATRELRRGGQGTAATSTAPSTFVDSSREWWDAGGRILAAWGILNPNGPTLYLLGLRDLGGTRRFYFRWLHMLGGETTDFPVIENPTYASILESATDIDSRLRAEGKSGLFPTPPYFILFDTDDAAMDGMLRTLVLACSDTPLDQGGPDWGAHLAYHRRFDTDFFGWAGGQLGRLYDEEMAAARRRGEEPSEMIRMLGLRYGHIPAYRDRQGPPFTPSPITAALRDEWWAAATTREFRIAALGQLKAMWEGACTQMAQAGHGGLVGWDRVVDFLADNELPLPR